MTQIDSLQGEASPEPRLREVGAQAAAGRASSVHAAFTLHADVLVVQPEEGLVVEADHIGHDHQSSVHEGKFGVAGFPGRTGPAVVPRALLVDAAQVVVGELLEHLRALESGFLEGAVNRTSHR